MDSNLAITMELVKHASNKFQMINVVGLFAICQRSFVYAKEIRQPISFVIDEPFFFTTKALSRHI